MHGQKNMNILHPLESVYLVPGPVSCRSLSVFKRCLAFDVSRLLSSYNNLQAGLKAKAIKFYTKYAIRLCQGRQLEMLIVVLAK